MEGHPLPPVDQYRRVQLARWIVNEMSGEISGEMHGADRNIRFDDSGRLVDSGMDVSPLIDLGEPFMTSGVPAAMGRSPATGPTETSGPRAPSGTSPSLPIRYRSKRSWTQLGLP